MPVYTAPTKDTQFILHDVLKVSEASTPGYDELERDFTAAILEEAGKISTGVWQFRTKSRSTVKTKSDRFVYMLLR